MKTILQGVVARGTARAIASLSPYVAGKTGTTEDAVDGWFIGFTNDVTVAVWVGYDNADRKRRSLGSSETGASVALPIFQPIIEAVWARKIAPKAPLSGPSPEAQGRLVDAAIDYQSGDRLRGGHGFAEHFRLGADEKFTTPSIRSSPANPRTMSAAPSAMKAMPAASCVPKPLGGPAHVKVVASKRKVGDRGASLRFATILRFATTITIGSPSAARTRAIFRANIIRDVRNVRVYGVRSLWIFRLVAREGFRAALAAQMADFDQR